MSTRKQPLYFIAIASLSIFVLVQTWVYTTVITRTKRGFWYEETYSKGALLSSTPTPDFIFIGSSKTQNHIDTQHLRKKGIPSFNYGLPGITWESQAYSIYKSINKAKTAIVLSIDQNDLTTPPKWPNSGTILADFRLREETGIATSIEAFSLKNLSQSLPTNYFPKYLKVASRTKTKSAVELINQRQGNDFILQPEKINYIRGHKNRYVVTLANGDSFICSQFHLPETPPSPNTSSPRLSDEAVELVLAYNSIITEAGLKLILIIEPTRWNTPSEIQISQLKDLLPNTIQIFDNTKFKPSIEGWADVDHFNRKGRQEYTRLIETQLRKYSQN